MVFFLENLSRIAPLNTGTIICALVNGRIIGFCSAMLEKKFELKDAFHIRKYFE